MIKIGNKNVSNFMIGNKQVDKIYSGKTLIWPDMPTVERWYLFDSTTKGEGPKTGKVAGYSSDDLICRDQYGSMYPMQNFQILLGKMGNRTVTFKNIITNKSYTKMGIKCEVPIGNSGKYNASDIRLSLGLDTSKAGIYAGNGLVDVKSIQFYTFYGSSDREKYPWTFPTKIVETDITALNGEDFYLQIHDCDCDLYIYSIWFE